MPFDDLLADRQADTRSRVISPCVQPLEQGEDPFLVLRLDADAVIANTERPRTEVACGRNVHLRCFVRAVELDPVGDQVLKQLAELSRIALHHWQIITDYLGL